MKVRECYESALSFIPEKPEENPDMQKFMIAWCNVILGEMLEYENVFRRAKGLAELEKVPVLTEKEQEIPYNENLVKRAFPYGMARWMFREGEDIAASHEYYNLYIAAANEATPVFEGDVKDIYEV